VDVQIALIQAATEFERDFVELLKREDLSPAQFNVLRILRGAGDAGATCGEVGGKLIRHDPDVTRLVDRLERRRLVQRTRELADRRIVRTRITDAGLDLLARLDPDVDALHETQLGHMSTDKLAQLKALIQEARARRRT
jgi:DNA-binding MarR family transcriptional regulator